ncbi:MAG: hypothetical protein Q9219_002208 [cf. Caloplaca sp. 3 TL-2023]
MASFKIQPLNRFAAGINASIRRPRLDDTVDDHLDSLLKTIIDLERRTASRCQADIITWRGMMTKIVAAPFDMFNRFEMKATRFQGTIFIEEDHAQKLASRQAQHNQPPQPGTASQDLMSYWGMPCYSPRPGDLLYSHSDTTQLPPPGYKFETLSLLPVPWAEASRDYIEGREDMIVNNNAQYCSVVKTGIGTSKLILGGEVDAIWDIKPPDLSHPINWVELKTAATPNSDRDLLKYERKLLKFWIQSFLLGVPRIIVGFRSREGVLQSLKELETARIPGMVKHKGKGNWDGNVCINFAAEWLEWLRATIAEDGGVWRIRKREKGPVIEVSKIEESGHGDILSREFVEWRQEAC